MLCDPFNVLLNSVYLYFVEDFCICVHQWYWPVIVCVCVCVCVCVLASSGFGIEVILAWYRSNLVQIGTEFRSNPLQFFWNSLRTVGVNSSLNVRWNSPVKPSVLDFYLLGVFIITDSFSFLVIGLFIFSFSSVLGDGIFLGICTYIPSRMYILLACNCSQ